MKENLQAARALRSRWESMSLDQIEADYHHDGVLPAVADPRDRALVEAIVMCALRQRARFDAALAQWMAKPLEARDHELRALLHAGFAQLEMGLPAHAAVAVSVGAARALARPHPGRLVSAQRGIARRAHREGAGEPAPRRLLRQRRLQVEVGGDDGRRCAAAQAFDMR